MNLDELTLGQVKQLANMVSTASTVEDNFGGYIGQKVIIRTYSAGVWYGTLHQKAKNEVILKCARRLWKFWAKKSLSLSAVAKYGVKAEDSRFAPEIDSVWLEAIEILPTTTEAQASIEAQPDDAENS